MRTTISLDARLAMQVRSEAAAQGLGVSAFIGKTLDDAIKRREAVMDKPFRLITVGGGAAIRKTRDTGGLLASQRAFVGAAERL